jgi:imidazole glycerol-phosphate synthase subunit HisH
MVGVIDIGLGNIKSITNWLDRCAVPWKLIYSPDDSQEYQLIILPGVGSVLEFITKLEQLHFTDFLKRQSQRGQRILGICLGAHVLFDYSEEDGGVHGLGLMHGTVRHITLNSSNTGWLPCSFDKRLMNEIWKSQKQNISRKQRVNGRVFFNHNYGIQLEEAADIDLKIQSEELSGFSAFVHKKNLIACQFHPEKSQLMGELILKMIL